MSTLHRVTRVGAVATAKVCWRIDCHAPGSVARNGRFYCVEHAGPERLDVTAAQVAAARTMQIEGFGLTDIAEHLGVSKSDLDRALWRDIDHPVSAAEGPGAGQQPPPEAA